MLSKLKLNHWSFTTPCPTNFNVKGKRHYLQKATILEKILKQAGKVPDVALV